MANEGAAAISGGLGLGGALVSGLFARSENQQNRKWQEKMYHLSVENNREDAAQANEWQKELQRLSVDEALRAKREGYLAEIEGMRKAGLNPMLLMNGNGVSGVGGIGAPSSAQANSAHYGTPPTLGIDTSGFNTAGDAIMQAALIKSEAELNKAKAEEIRGETAPIQRTMEEQQAHIEEINGKLNLMLAQGGLFKAQTANTDANTKWQNIQNGIAEMTKDYQAETIKWQLFNLRKDYELAIQEIKGKKIENEQKTKYLEAQINLFNQQAGLALANAGLTTQQTQTEIGRDKYMEKQNQLLYLQMPSLIDMSKWEAKNEKEFRERYEEFLSNQRRGQNLQFAGDIIKGIVGAGTSFYGAGKIAKGMAMPTHTWTRTDKGKGWSETETYTKRGLGL